MQKEQLTGILVELLQKTLNDLSEGVGVAATPDSQLIGPEAVMTSMGMVTFIADVECILAERFGLEVTLVSEQALSRRNSPFRNVTVLADYILELAGAPAETSLVREE